MTELTFLATKRYIARFFAIVALVTGGNKGIGLGICRKLALNGVTVVLTARDKKGMEAVENLHRSGLSSFVIFHQLDVLDSTSIAALADFVKSHFGKGESDTVHFS
ncbi:salutaridine reductase-like [Heracleum sosnowskyi]|uniref:Salutaridine reductase-like n=1 Tax=Heracleum sosnowskyi TaxID=360622 RepID=A0AAD8J0H6_9APIA|nr:salutaridine reductase-like [Heracleum sosnowskyi]